MATDISNEKIKQIGTILNDKSTPIGQRFRALFTLRNIGNDECVQQISYTLLNDCSALLKHECAYCLGQMQNSSANHVLSQVLANVDEHPMVRHEAGEALAAIGSQQSLPILQKFASDLSAEVAETCALAIKRIEWLASGSAHHDSHAFTSVDPAPPLSHNSVSQLKAILLNSGEDMFARYRAMFALRNLNSDDSALALADALACGHSALFRHEIAFVLGQMQNPCTVPQLAAVLEDQTENEMVRHECAEALGAIATEDANRILHVFLNDKQTIVRESIQVALDMSDYNNSDEFQYANALLNV